MILWLHEPASDKVVSTSSAPSATALMPGPALQTNTYGISTGAIILGVVAVALVSGAAGIWAWQTSWSPTSDDSSQASAGSASSTAATGGTAAATDRSASPTATAAPASTAAPARTARPAAESVGACVATLLPADAFGAKVPDMSAICQARDPHRGALRIKTELVKAGGRDVTDAMREWSKLGWYEMAAFATIRAHCCDQPAKLVGPTMVRPCKLDEALAALGAAGGNDEAMKQATQAFGKAAECIGRAGGASAFDQVSSPSGGEVKYFEKIVARIPN